MSPEEIQKLLGGYATGTLTPEERETLFAEALEDQQLFDSLVQEEPLRELLQDPVAKNRLRAALEVPTRVAWHRGWLRPAALAATAAGIVAIGVVAVHQHRPPRPVDVATVEPVRPPAVVLPAPPPPAAARARKPLLAKAVPSRQGFPTTPEAPQAKDVELPAAQPALKQAVAENQAELRPAAPPLPAPPPVDAQAAGPAPPVIGLAGARAGGRGMVGNLRDARALFSEPAPSAAPTFRSNLVRTESLGPARAEAVNAPVADAVPAPPAHLGLRYTVWQRPPAGIFAQVPPGAGLNADDEIELQLQTNDFGYLYVLERGADGAWNLRATDRLARMAVYTVPQSGALRPGASGVLEFFVLFSRRPLSEQDRQAVSPVDQQVSDSPADRATYVASTSNNPAAQRIGFPITLRVQSH